MVFTRRQSSRLAASKEAPVDDATIDLEAQLPKTPSRTSKLPKSTSSKNLVDDSKPLPAPPSTSGGPLSFLSALTARTPTNKSPIKPSSAVMHPEHHQKSTSTPLEEARWLGFSQMGTQTATPKANATLEEKIAAQTPSRTSTARKSLAPVDKFEFTFRRQSSVELSDAAQKMMAESREEARKLRERMMAELSPVPAEEPGAQTQSKIEEGAASRKIAKPKGKAGRYSEVHMAEFKKMDSITNHPSAWRTDPSRFKNTNIVTDNNTKSLKRTASKTELDRPDSKSLAVKPFAGSAIKVSSPVKSTFTTRDMASDDVSPFITRTTGRRETAGSHIPSPSKRVKHSDDMDSSKSRQTPATNLMMAPQSVGSRVTVDRPAGLSHLMTPTKSSLARANSVHSLKTTRLPMSSLMRSKSAKIMSKFRPVAQTQAAKPIASLYPNLSQIPGPHTPSGQIEAIPAKPISPTPIKVAIAINDTPVQAPAELAMSPTATPEPSLVSKLKSCLRTPHRLYSTDAIKIAAGTHFATPPRVEASELLAPATAPVNKRVDFSTSTKERAQIDEARAASVEPTDNGLYPPLPTVDEGDNDSRRSTISSLPIPGAFTFRATTPLKFTPLPNTHSTIRSVRTSDITPNPLPLPPTSAAKLASKRKATDALPQISEQGETSDKENQSNRDDDRIEDDRPVKRVRKMESGFSAPGAIAAPSTIPSVTPAKGTLAQQTRQSIAAKSAAKGKRPGLSAARLSMLAQPKKRD